MFNKTIEELTKEAERVAKEHLQESGYTGGAKKLIDLKIFTSGFISGYSSATIEFYEELDRIKKEKEEDKKNV